MYTPKRTPCWRHNGTTSSLLAATASRHHRHRKLSIRALSERDPHFPGAPQDLGMGLRWTAGDSPTVHPPRIPHCSGLDRSRVGPPVRRPGKSDHSPFHARSSNPRSSAASPVIRPSANPNREFGYPPGAIGAIRPPVPMPGVRKLE